MRRRDPLPPNALGLLRAVAVLLALGLGVFRPPAGIAQENALLGQTVTLLPNGQELLIGGLVGGNVVKTVSLRDPQTGDVTPVLELQHGRAWHTATLLPDGSVLVLGGVGESGSAVDHVESVDLSSGTRDTMPAVNWQPRAGHSATLISARHVVLAGGMAGDTPANHVELFDLDQWLVTPVGELPTPRAYHSAALQASGRIVLWGGQGSDGPLGDSGVVVDPLGWAIYEVVAPEEDQRWPGLAASDPEDGSNSVGLNQRVTLRFARPARMESVTTATISLAGASGVVQSMVAPAEAGRLAFLTPLTTLAPDTTYVVTVDGIVDTQGTAFPPFSITFKTLAEPAPVAVEQDDDTWDPSPGGWKDWRTNRPASPWQEQPPLQAPPGVTAVSGQVLRLNGSPLRGVTLELGGQKSTTDATGRFLLEIPTVPTDWHELWIDGRTANRPGVTYGTFEAAVHITEDVTTVLPFTIWLPKIDTAHSVEIPSPTTTETVITTPKIPGLELRLPAGTVVRAHDGTTARELSITPIPLDRPPFPLPDGVDVPIYFTVQPGGGYVEVSSSGNYRRGARLIYPNYKGRPAGSPMEFWHYDPEAGRRWYVYGRGQVSTDGSQIVPDRGAYVYEFTGAMVAGPGLRPSENPVPEGPQDGDPVDLGSGLFVMKKTDLRITDILPIGIERTYRPNDTVARSFGIGSTHLFDMFLVGNTYPYTYIELVLPGGVIRYDRLSPGTGYADAVYEHASSPTAFFKSRISWNGAGWNLDLKDGSRIVFPDSFTASRPAQAAATSIRDRFGNLITLTRNADRDLTHIGSPHGRWIALTYDANHRITQARDNINRVVQYTYDASGRLWKVTDVMGGVTEYTYDASHRMLTIKDPRGIVYLTNEYDAGGRVIRQVQADGSDFELAYTLDGGGKITRVDVTDPRGIVRRVDLNASGYPTSDTMALGQPQQQTTTYSWQAGTNLLLSITDPLNRQTTFGYDAYANPTAVTRLAGTGSAITESFTYEPTFQQMTTATDALGRVTTFTCNAQGALVNVRDPLNRDTILVSNGFGQVTSITNPMGHQTQFLYDGGDLVATTDPLGRTTSMFTDSAGRTLSVRNPLGQVTSYQYNAFDNVIAVTDPMGGQTTVSYDSNANLLSLTDARGKTTSYTYSSMDRVASRTDPLARTETFAYDLNGNLIQTTDRKGQVTTHAYDALNRLTTTTYADLSSTNYTYDAGSRQTQIVDSISGTITRGYDLADRLISETTTQGTVNYTYDAADRRLSMTVAGQPALTYSYDNADRLIAITQNGASVSFTFDNSHRRTTHTLPNGVVVEYAYDSGSQLTGLTYKLGQTTLGNLTYAYDLAGNRAAVGGSWARTNLPAPLASATYDNADQIVQFGGVTFAYDADGNLTADGTGTYTWNARNQLISLIGTASASFSYDGAGRRRSKTIGGITTEFLYDGLNPVQEQTGGVVSASLFTGLAIDEYFARADGTGVRQFLTDALGSTVALTDPAGSVETSYTYDPFGGFSTTGGGTNNPVAFTGREADGPGLLYFYRARYYDPRTQRFVSQDPIEFAGGDVNLYGYVRNAPQDSVDPLGLQGGSPWWPWNWGDRFQDWYERNCKPQGGRKDLKQGDENDEEYRKRLQRCKAWDDILNGEGVKYGEMPFGPGLFSGFTKHGIDQVITRGFHPSGSLTRLGTRRKLDVQRSIISGGTLSNCLAGPASLSSIQSQARS